MNADQTVKDELANLREVLNTTSRHKFDKQRQREEFAKHLSRVKPRHAVLVMDFKENIQLNSGPDEVCNLTKTDI